MLTRVIMGNLPLNLNYRAYKFPPPAVLEYRSSSIPKFRIKPAGSPRQGSAPVFFATVRALLQRGEEAVDFGEARGELLAFALPFPFCLIFGAGLPGLEGLEHRSIGVEIKPR